jgi:hypothetical protein
MAETKPKTVIPDLEMSEANEECRESMPERRSRNGGSEIAKYM